MHLYHIINICVSIPSPLSLKMGRDLSHMHDNGSDFSRWLPDTSLSTAVVFSSISHELIAVSNESFGLWVAVRQGEWGRNMTNSISGAQ